MKHFFIRMLLLVLNDHSLHCRKITCLQSIKINSCGKRAAIQSYCMGARFFDAIHQYFH